MAEPSLTDVFGAGASQTSANLTVAKSALAAVGLSVTAENTAESLLAAIILLAKAKLTEASFSTNIDQSVVIASGFNSIVQRDTGNNNFSEYRQFQYTVNFHKIDNNTFDPDDF